MLVDMPKRNDALEVEDELEMMWMQVKEEATPWRKVVLLHSLQSLAQNLANILEGRDERAAG